jgi:hypothetical protein
VADTVHLHVGLPKTGTTYLQSILWANKAALAEAGVLLPGASSREHMWASGVVREEPRIERRSPKAVSSWARLVEEVKQWSGTALISHEFFGGATAEQAERAMADLAPAEPHLVVTARDALTVVTSYSQEYVKHGFDGALDDFPRDGGPADVWSWRTVDLTSVLQRWGATLPPDHVHVLVVPGAGAPREALWQELAGVIGIDPDGYELDRTRENSSLGLVEAELMRKVSPELKGFTSPLDRGVWLRSYLAHGKLVPRGGERFYPSPARVAELRRHADEAVDLIRGRGFHVVGDLELLRVPESLEDRRHPDDVTEHELLEAATGTIAELLADVRMFRRENTELKREKAAAEPPAPPAEPPAPPPEPPSARIRRRIAGLSTRLRRDDGGD